MDALTFLERHGKPVCVAVAKRAGTKWEYFSQIAYGHRRPSVDLAHALVKASSELVQDEDGRLDVLSLLRPRKAAASSSEPSAA